LKPRKSRLSWIDIEEILRWAIHLVIVRPMGTISSSNKSRPGR